MPVRLLVANEPLGDEWPAGVKERQPSAEDEVMRRLEADRVTTIIAALPRDQRHVLIMQDVQGLPGAVVARSLGLSTDAMKSRLHRARASVRVSLDSGNPDLR